MAKTAYQETREAWRRGALLASCPCKPTDPEPSECPVCKSKVLHQNPPDNPRWDEWVCENGHYFATTIALVWIPSVAPSEG